MNKRKVPKQTLINNTMDNLIDIYGLHSTIKSVEASCRTKMKITNDSEKKETWHLVAYCLRILAARVTGYNL